MSHGIGGVFPPTVHGVVSDRPGECPDCQYADMFVAELALPVARVLAQPCAKHEP